MSKRGYFVIHRETQDRQFFQNWDTLSSFLNHISEPKEWQYGCWRQNPRSIKSHLLKSFLNHPHSGFTSGQLQAELRKLQGQTVYVGIRGHLVPKNTIWDIFELPGRYFRGLRFSKFDYSDSARILISLRNYLERQALSDPQILVTAVNKSKYQPSDLPIFCFPDLNPRLTFFETLTELKAIVD